MHHLPVVAEGRVLGVVTAGDIVRLQQADPVFMVGDISRQRDVESLARTSQRSHQLVAQLLRQDASSDDITRLLTTVADAITRLTGGDTTVRGYGLRDIGVPQPDGSVSPASLAAPMLTVTGSVPTPKPPLDTTRSPPNTATSI